MTATLLTAQSVKNAVRTYRARKAAVRSALQPAEPKVAGAGAVLAILIFGAALYLTYTPVPMPASGNPEEWRAAKELRDVWRVVALDFGVECAVLGALAFVSSLWIDRWVGIGFIVALVAVDLVRVGTGVDNPTLQAIATGVLILQALSPLWMKGVRGVLGELRELAAVTKTTREDTREAIRAAVQAAADARGSRR